MSHRYSGPNLGFPGGGARLNLIVDVHPQVALKPNGPTPAVPSSTDARYAITIDTNGDAVADLAYSVRFSASDGAGQTATLRRIEVTQAVRSGEDGEAIVQRASVSTGHDAAITSASDYRFFAHSPEHTGGYAPEDARPVASTLLPDMLPYEPGRPAYVGPPHAAKGETAHADG